MAQHVIVGAGSVGSALALRRAESGHAVRMATRSGAGPVHASIERVAEATDGARLADLARGATALHNCANPPYRRCATDWSPLSDALLLVAERSGAVLVATADLYGYGPVDGAMTEDAPFASAEGTKGAVRNRMWSDALAAHEAGRIRATEARASDFHGPGLRDTGHVGEDVVPRMLAGKRELVMQGDLDAPHSFTHVDDVVATPATMAVDERAWGRAWHVPTAPAVSLREVARRIATIAGVPDRGLLVLPRAAVRIGGPAVPFLRRTGGGALPVRRVVRSRLDRGAAHVRPGVHGSGRGPGADGGPVARADAGLGLTPRARATNGTLVRPDWAEGPFVRAASRGAYGGAP